MNRTHRRPIARLALSLAATIVATLVVTATPAQADAPSLATALTQARGQTAPLALVYLQSRHTLECLQDSFDGGVDSDTCSDYDGQIWDFAGSKFKNVGHTQRCLQDAFDGGLATNNCINYNGQLWTLILVRQGGEELVQIKNNHTQKCLQDAFNGGPGTVACDVTAPITNLQLWY